MDAGDAFRRKNQFDAAIPKYCEAERFWQNLKTEKFSALLSEQRSLAGRSVAPKRNPELEQAYSRLVGTLREQGDLYDIDLGNACRMLAVARSHLNNWAGAELTLREAHAIYEQIILHFSEPAPRLALQAQQQKDFTTWYPAVVTATLRKSISLSSWRSMRFWLSLRGRDRETCLR
jgi:hypothetical protein